MGAGRWETPVPPPLNVAQSSLHPLQLESTSTAHKIESKLLNTALRTPWLAYAAPLGHLPGILAWTSQELLLLLDTCAHPSPQIMQPAPWVGALLLLCLSKLYSSNAPEIPNPIAVWALHPVWVRATKRAPAPPRTPHPSNMLAQAPAQGRRGPSACSPRLASHRT